MKRNLLSKIFGKRETTAARAPLAPPEQTKARASLDLSDQTGRSDYLGKAADAKHAAKAAVKAGEHDKAWGLFHEQKEHYLKHAQKMGFDAEQVMRMDGSVSEDFANILRIEKRHTQALVHILYWIATSTIPSSAMRRNSRPILGGASFRQRRLMMQSDICRPLTGYRISELSSQKSRPGSRFGHHLLEDRSCQRGGFH